MVKVMFKNARLFDGRETGLKENAALLVEKGKIAGLQWGLNEEEMLNLENKWGAGKVYNVEGKILMPGLIDSHIHLDMKGLADTYEENLVEDKLRSVRAAKEMENTLMAGITTVRNCGSVNWIDVTVKEAVGRGFIPGPRILTSGKIICITSAGTEYFDGLYREADGYDGFKEAAREQLKMGVDLLKIMATGAIMNPGGVPAATQPDIEEIQAVVEEAEKLNKKVAAHAHGAEGIKNAVIAGVDTIEHGTFADEEAHRMMIEHGVYLVPTLAPDYFMALHGLEGGVAPFMIKKLKEKRVSRLEALHRAVESGVKIAAGSDAGTPYNYHGKNASELIVMVEEGIMSPAQALICATRCSAEACGLLEKTGTVEEGKCADLIVVEGDPFSDIKEITEEENMVLVMKEGAVYKDKISPRKTVKR